MPESQLPATTPTDSEPSKSDAAVVYEKGGAEVQAREVDMATVWYGPEGVKKSDAELAPYNLRLPEGTFVDKPLLTEFTAWARESNFTTQQAQRAADLNLKSIAANHRQLQAESQAQVKKWGDEVRNDRELGGANLPETIAAAEKLFTLAETIPGVNLTRFKNDLVRTGMANHPDLIRIARHIGVNFCD